MKPMAKPCLFLLEFIDPFNRRNIMSHDACVSKKRRYRAFSAAVILLAACDTGRTASDDVCRMQMRDSANATDSILQAKEIITDHYIVTDRLTSSDPWSVEVKVTSDDRIETNVNNGVPKITIDELMNRYIMKNDQQLTFTSVAGCPCAPFETSLIYFLIMEWFYFG
jgi:hypothetical protein